MDRMSRRRFLALGGASVAALLAACKGKSLNQVLITPRPSPATGQAYRLDPNYGSDPTACPAGGCVGCAACRSHAANRILPSAQAGRAHPGCKCLALPDPSIDAATYAALFTPSVNNPTGGAVDRRWGWVTAVLAG